MQSAANNALLGHAATVAIRRELPLSAVYDLIDADAGLLTTEVATLLYERVLSIAREIRRDPAKEITKAFEAAGSDDPIERLGAAVAKTWRQ